MERIERAFKPSFTMDAAYEWSSDRLDIWGRDPEVVEANVARYERQFRYAPECPEMSPADDDGLMRAAERDWAGTVRQLRSVGLEAVLREVRKGNHWASPF
jgi:hypothetical protein